MKKEASFSVIMTILFVLVLTGVLAGCGGGGGGSAPSGNGDTIAPTTPLNFKATASSSSQINLSWNASTDNVIVVGYKIYRGGVYLKSVTGITTSDTGLISNTAYCYTVSAYDAANNESLQSTQACATTADGIPPTTPQNLRATTVSSSRIDLSWDASTDNVGVVGYKIYRDGILLIGITTSDTGLRASTSYCYTVSAVDAAGNESSQSTQACATTHYTKQLGTASQDYGSGDAVDSSGNTYVAGATRGDFDGNTSAGLYDGFLVKYNSAGAKQWTRQLGTASNDYATGVAVDASGNAYVTGYTYGGLDGNTNAGSSDIFLVKYNSAGVKQWTRQMGTTGPDESYGVAVDTSGNAYITGYTQDSLDGNTFAGSDDMFLVKYDSAGTKQWTRQLGTTAGETGYAVAVDSSGNVYVTGRTGGDLDGIINTGTMNVFLVKYNSAGIKQWARVVDSLNTYESAEGKGVAVDTSGNIYVTGDTDGGLDGNINVGSYDMFLVKYNASGIKQWSRQTGTTTSDIGTGVAVDTSGNAYVTGYTAGGLDGNTNVGSNDMFLMKYDSVGTKQWTRQLGTTAGDLGRGVAVDSSGNAYVTGDTGGGLDGNTSAGSNDMFLVKYNANGVIQ